MSKRSIITKIDGIPVEPTMALTQIVHEAVVELPMTELEIAEHNKYVDAINQGMQDIARTSLEVWNAVQWINEHRSYRYKYDTFNDFCKIELGKDNSQIYRHLKDAKFKEQLLLVSGSDEEKSSIMALKESNTRFIRELPEDVWTPFWKLTYVIGSKILPKKEDGSVELTTSFLQTVGGKIDDIMHKGGIDIDGQFISINKMEEAADIAGCDADTAKAVLMAVGVSEEVYESLKRQEQHIKERSIKADYIPLRGTISHKVDVNGSDYPVLVDSKGNTYDLVDLLLSFRERFVQLSIRAPILN